MSEKHVTTIIVGSFDQIGSAEAALKQLKDLATIGVHDAALVEKTEDGKLHVKDTKDWGWGKGAVLGGLAGIVIGIIAPPAGLIIGAVTGAGIGGLAAGLHDAGINSDTLNALGATLSAGGAAIVLAVEPDHAQAAEDALTQAGAATVREGLSGEAVAVLRQGLEPTEDVQEQIARDAMQQAKQQ